MKILNYAMGAGKTYEAVKYAKENGCALVVTTRAEKYKIISDYNYKNVYTLIDIQSNALLGKQIHCVVIDNIDRFLNYLFNAEVELTTITGAELETRKVLSKKTVIVYGHLKKEIEDVIKKEAPHLELISEYLPAVTGKKADIAILSSREDSLLKSFAEVSAKKIYSACYALEIDKDSLWKVNRTIKFKELPYSKNVGYLSIHEL